MTAHTRPWTAILCTKSNTKIVNLEAPSNPVDAKSSIENTNPGWSLVGLIPGSHKSGSHCYDLIQELPRKEQVYVDPFDMTHVR